MGSNIWASEARTSRGYRQNAEIGPVAKLRRRETTAPLRRNSTVPCSADEILGARTTTIVSSASQGISRYSVRWSGVLIRQAMRHARFIPVTRRSRGDRHRLSPGSNARCFAEADPDPRLLAARVHADPRSAWWAADPARARKRCRARFRTTLPPSCATLKVNQGRGARTQQNPYPTK